MDDEVDIVVVHQESEQQFLAVAKKCLMSKVTWRLMPILVLLEISSYINRVSIGEHSSRKTDH